MVTRILMLAAFFGLAGSAGYFTYLQLRPDEACAVCHRSVHMETSYVIHFEDGETRQVCCPRCGLRYQKGRHNVTAVEVADYDSGEFIDASQALFVENSSVNLCHQSMVQEDRSGSQYQLTWDRCLPSLIAFRTREGAEVFRRDYGGLIKTYGELLKGDF